jgi:putative transcriptional regulator
MKKQDLAKKIGKQIKVLREKKGWSQSDLARALMKDRQLIQRVEDGKTNPTVFTLHGIAEALGVPLSDIFK